MPVSAWFALLVLSKVGSDLVKSGLDWIPRSPGLVGGLVCGIEAQ